MWWWAWVRGGGCGYGVAGMGTGWWLWVRGGGYGYRVMGMGTGWWVWGGEYIGTS